MKFSGGGPFSLSLGHVPPCINSTAQMNWLNRADVRKALHISDILPPWDICRYVTNNNECEQINAMPDICLYNENDCNGISFESVCHKLKLVKLLFSKRKVIGCNLVISFTQSQIRTSWCQKEKSVGIILCTPSMFVPSVITVHIIVLEIFQTDRNCHPSIHARPI